MTMKSQKRLIELDRLGIELLFGDDNNYTKDELKAMHYISSDKVVPKDLEQRLLSTREQRLKRFRSTSIAMPTNEEVEMLTGIKLK